MLLFLLFVDCFGLKAKYLDGDVHLQPITSSTDQIKRIQSRKSDQLKNVDDINPLLLNGTRGSPGLEFRINPKGFSYASLLAGPIINDEIRRLQIPSSKKCFQELNGCIRISNLAISRYRCPQLISLHPAPPNRLILAIRNLDFEIEGNLEGEIGAVFPITLNNTIFTRFYQTSSTIQLTVHRTLNGSSYVRIIRCYTSIGFTDVLFKNDSLLGNVFNSNFRSIVEQQIRKQLPSRFCKIIRNIVEEKINVPLRTISKSIPLNKCIVVFKLDDLIDDNMHETNDNSSMRQLSSTSHTKMLQHVNLSSISSMSDTDIREMETSNLDSCIHCDPNNRLISLQNVSDLNSYFDVILSDMRLNMHLMKVSATPDRFQVGFLAAFGTEEIDKIPFYPFPMNFPQHFADKSNERMLDILIGDYTANSLLYYFHKRGIIMFRIGPETPKIGELLKTTCGEDYDGFDDFDINDDEDFDDSGKNSTAAFFKFTKRRRKRNTVNDNININDDSDNNGGKKEDNLFSDLGICIGDIMPAIREKYPKKFINIKIHTSYAPSIILLAKNNGTARVNLQLEAVFYVEDSNDKIGTMIISTIINGNIRISGKRIGVIIKIQSLKFIDKERTFGLSSDALDNLAHLAKDFISQVANNRLSKEYDIELGNIKLPFHLVKPKFTIIDHAFHISTDYSIPASLFGVTSSTICR
ncbi:Uncharacterized protein ACO02O_08849 [Dirofilaria immitis]